MRRRRRAAEREERIIWRPVRQLLLDPQNPRITPPVGASEDDLLRILYESEALEELALSLSRNGYFTEEPMVIVPHGTLEGMFVVVEGNRRLAAIKILLDPDLRRRLGAADWPHLSAERATELVEVPTVSYPSREAVVPYLGFRHITGIKTWDPFAKARYVAQLIDSGRAMEEVEEAIGDSARTVKKLYQTYIVHRQVQSDLAMDTTPIRKRFSLLEVALSQQPIKRFLGISRELPSTQTDEIVPDNRLPALREIVSWIYGDPENGQDAIISDSRQISRFSSSYRG